MRFGVTDKREDAMKRGDWIKVTALAVMVSASLLTAAWRASARASAIKHNTEAITKLEERVEGFQMALSEDVSGLRERVAKLEGAQ